MNWQKEFDDLKKKESSLCELLIIRSLIDLTEYDSGDRWNWVEKKSNQFEVGLDFIAARLGYYSWRQIFYSEKFEPVFKEDIAISDILYDFVRNKRKKKKIPKSTDFSSQSNAPLRGQIINNCLTRDVLEKTKKNCGIFEISEDGKCLTVENKTIDSFDPTRWIDSIMFKCFPDSLPSFTSTKERSGQNLRKTDFNKIKDIQGNICFYCKTRPIQTQDHYIPEHYVHETKPSNIVGACNDCNRKKWDTEPPDRTDSRFFVIAPKIPENLKTLLVSDGFEYREIDF